MKLGSLFDGSGGFPLAGQIVGIKPVWASEIEPFCIRVTSKQFPDMKHLGDIRNVNGADIEPVDIITFGSPCQDLSMAGKREGLAGERSGLFMEAIRVIREMRVSTNGIYPRFIVWENVPGAYSSNHGNDFRVVLETIFRIKEPGASVPGQDRWMHSGIIMGHSCSIGWRTLNAQYWGVPQRRERIFLVADFNGQRAGEILFDSEGRSRYSAQMFKTWQNFARNFEKGTDSSSRLYDNHGADSRYTGPVTVCQTICQRFGTGRDNTPLIVTESVNGGGAEDILSE